MDTSTLINGMALLLSFTGTVLLALSIGPLRESPASGEDENGNKVEVAFLLKPNCFKWGLRLLAFAFLMQLVMNFFPKANCG